MKNPEKKLRKQIAKDEKRCMKKYNKCPHLAIYQEGLDAVVNKIVELGDLNIAIDFAKKHKREARTASLAKLADMVVRLGGTKICVDFAKNVQVGVVALGNKVAQIGSKKEIAEFIKIPGAPLVELCDKMSQVGDAKQIIDAALFVQKNKNLVQILSDGILRVGDAKEIEKFSKVLNHEYAYSKLIPSLERCVKEARFNYKCFPDSYTKEILNFSKEYLEQTRQAFVFENKTKDQLRAECLYASLNGVNLTSAQIAAYNQLSSKYVPTERE